MSLEALLSENVNEINTDDPVLADCVAEFTCTKVEPVGEEGKTRLMVILCANKELPALVLANSGKMPFNYPADQEYITSIFTSPSQYTTENDIRIDLAKWGKALGVQTHGAKFCNWVGKTGTFAVSSRTDKKGVTRNDFTPKPK